MKKVKYFGQIVLFGLLLTLSSGLRAQVTIGSGIEPDVNALLDLKETSTGTSTKGLLIPRVALTDASLPTPMINHVAGMTVYNTAASPTDGSVDIKNYVSPGFYYNTGNRWEKLHLGTANWFYMPSIVIDVTTSGTFTRDLYLEYRKQFEDTMDSTPVSPQNPALGTALIKSPAAPNPFTSIFDADKLYYYVTGYDATAFSDISIAADGKLTYTINADNVTDATYMNIVFVEK